MQFDDSEHLKLHGSLDRQALPRLYRNLRLGFLLVAGFDNDFSLGLLYKLEQTKRIMFVKMKTYPGYSTVLIYEQFADKTTPRYQLAEKF